jgi:5-bromo-4-chloroindolyl phosphate hydrolysis protein
LDILLIIILFVFLCVLIIISIAEDGYTYSEIEIDEITREQMKEVGYTEQEIENILN